jgi:hypothetical protein
MIVNLNYKTALIFFPQKFHAFNKRNAKKYGKELTFRLEKKLSDMLNFSAKNNVNFDLILSLSENP